MLQEVHPDSGNSLSSRSRILKELCEVVAAKQLEEVQTCTAVGH